MRKWYVPGICPSLWAGTTHIPAFSSSSVAYNWSGDLFCLFAISMAFGGSLICGNAYKAPCTSLQLNPSSKFKVFPIRFAPS